MWFTDDAASANKIGRLNVPAGVERSFATVADFDATVPLKNELSWRGSTDELRHWSMTTTPGPGITLGARGSG